MLLVRIELPDRPGSLGQVATALGTIGADIEAIEIVAREEGRAVNHFRVELPAGVMPDALVTACGEIEDVFVQWVSRYPDSWGLHSDIQTLNEMAADPDHAPQILTSAAPVVFHGQWAALLGEREVQASSEMAPELGQDLVADLRSGVPPQRRHLDAGWIPGWAEQEVAIAALPGGSRIVVGRSGGPVFLDSELRRLSHLAALVNE